MILSAHGQDSRLLPKDRCVVRELCFDKVYGV